MQKPYRHLNLLVPFETYEALRKLSINIGRPYAEIVREAINSVLKVKSKEENCKNGSNCNE